MSNRWIALWFVALSAAALACITHLALRFEVIRLGYSLAEERKEQRRLLEIRHVLNLESSVLRHSQRIRHFAETRLGLVEPTSEQLYSVQKDTHE